MERAFLQAGWRYCRWTNGVVAQNSYN